MSLVNVDRYGASFHYSAREKAALALATIVAQSDFGRLAGRGEEAFAGARLHFKEDEILCLVTVISGFRWFNLWKTVVGSRLEAEPATIIAQLPWLAPLQTLQHGR